MKNNENEPKIEMMSQPLFTEEGFINEAGMNELSSAINNMPKTYDRLANDDEWSIKKGQWIFRKYIVGSFAKWACRQSPYNCPDNLETTCKYLDACLKRYFDWGKIGMIELSLIEINKACWDILKDFKPFLDWNECKKGKTPGISFSSSFDGPTDPDYDFIDLDALLHNVCLDIRSERREDDAFDKEFNEKWAKHQEDGLPMESSD